MATTSELLTEDARARFSHTKALFEQLERQNEATNVPSFYSPRPVRQPPPLPPKPAAGASMSNNGNPMSHSPCPSSPTSQVAHTFSEMASDLAKISSASCRSSANSTPSLDQKRFIRNSSDSILAGTPRGISPSTSSISNYGSLYSGNPLAPPPPPTSLPAAANSHNPQQRYEPYWRDPSFFKKRFGDDSDHIDAENDTMRHTTYALVKTRREDDESYAYSPDLGARFRESEVMSDSPKGLMETRRGLSPERREYEEDSRKVSFSTAPIPVYCAHSVDDYDRKNEEIDPVASCAEYELERRLERMQLFDVELDKGPEGLGVSIIGMGVGADSGLEKLGIFVKSITPGGAIYQDGRICVCDQIVSVDGKSLVGVSQLYAAETLRATTNRVLFTIGREPNLDESEVAQLIRQSLEQDRLRVTEEDNEPVDDDHPIHSSRGIDEHEIRTRISSLELELEESQKKADEMHNVLDDTKAHYEQLERKYDQANQLLRNYQEREKELLSREESHVEQLRDKDSHYAMLVTQLRERIEELESKLEEMDQRRQSITQMELAHLRDKLKVDKREELLAYKPSANELPQEDKAVMADLPFNPCRKDAEVSVGSSCDEDKFSSSCDSPIPRISEPASPALPHKFVHRKLLFPLRKRYLTNENEFWRASVEVQGLQVLHWSVDDVCQLLVSMGLDKYVPEFTINKINGAKFLDLDGSKLKGMGIQNHSDRSLIKKKVKMIKSRIERERKLLEKESRARVLNQIMPIQM
ncbi:unnamed protein product [Auanema sp. JU1783]|nr:unnamed protein product [Auanema sp. JU1783]